MEYIYDKYRIYSDSYIIAIEYILERPRVLIIRTIIRTLRCKGLL